MPKGKISILGSISIVAGLLIIVFDYFLGGLNIFALLAGILLFVIGALARIPAETKTCRFCRSEIHPLASVCPHCQREQVSVARPSPDTTCPTCGISQDPAAPHKHLAATTP